MDKQHDEQLRILAGELWEILGKNPVPVEFLYRALKASYEDGMMDANLPKWGEDVGSLSLKVKAAPKVPNPVTTGGEMGVSITPESTTHDN